MTATSSVDNTFSYHNDFENVIKSSATPRQAMSTSNDLHNDPTLQSFTATGRPISKTSASNKGTGLDGLNSAEAHGAGAPNLLPFRFTDQSIISVPVMPSPEASAYKSTASDSEEDDDLVKGRPKPRSKFSFSSFRRKSSSKKEKTPDFVMKDMTRAEYLKHYAKDEEGKYIGTEEPASDCILNTKKVDPFERRKKLASRAAFGDTHTAANFGFM